MVQKGVSLYEVQHLLGHESFQTTQRITPAAGRPRGGARSLGASGRAADQCRMKRSLPCPSGHGKGVCGDVGQGSRSVGSSFFGGVKGD
ncbi:hypothetical protein [Streptomyces phaeochromogenes]|uniref:hypothetical protein n=1 Tax=Streptomyces phaeochromogenes TaxID=1923 RepID=UPI00398D103B